MKTKFKWWKTLALLTLGATITAPIAALSACGHESSSQSSITPSELPKNYTLAQLRTNITYYTTNVTSMDNSQLAQELKTLTNGLNSLNTVSGLNEYAIWTPPINGSNQDAGWTLKPGKTLEDIYQFFADKISTNFYPTWDFFKNFYSQDEKRMPINIDLFYITFKSIFDYVKSTVVLRQYFVANKNSFSDLNSPTSKQIASGLLGINSMKRSQSILSTTDGVLGSILGKQWWSNDLGQELGNNFVNIAKYVETTNNEFAVLFQTIIDKYKIVNDNFTKQANKCLANSSPINMRTGLVQGIILADPTQTTITLKSAVHSIF